MEDIVYQGEHLFPGVAGNLFSVLAFLAAGLAVFGYYKAVKSKDNSWLKFGRLSFRIHSIAVLGVIGMIFYILIGHYYEYHYAWSHLNDSMPMRYILSCFWEGQEGSFLLWSFWHIVLGNILIRTAKNWEAPVMAIFSVVQVFIASMVIGVYMGDFQFGQSPFLLLRETQDFYGLPWTQNPNYLFEFVQFQDGRGLNPLLQNYWNTIHPPTLFLGFASVVVPFCYALAGLWTRKMTEWMTPAIPWTFFSVAVFGLGILMGGAWAYEALGFGGFWAWDPVENASLVPWITLVAGAHLLVVNKRKPTALFSAFLFITVSFILVLYSTFLTRSGVLGDTSVHSFVESGILRQLLAFLLFFCALTVGLFLSKKRHRLTYWAGTIVLFVGMVIFSIIAGHQPTDEAAAPYVSGALLLITAFILYTTVWLISSNYTSFPKQEKEEHLWSREFWMFMGGLVLVCAAGVISTMTSLPVLVDLAGAVGIELDWAPPKEVIPWYHKWAIPFTIIIMLLIAMSQWFKYKKTAMDKFWKSIARSLIVSIAITILFIVTPWFSTTNRVLYGLLFASVFAVMSNADYIIKVLKGSRDKWGASVAHIGFSFMIFGSILSMSQQEIVSQNKLGNIKDLNENFSNSEDMVMYEGDTLEMDDYFVRYINKYVDADSVHLRCQVEYYDKLPKRYKEGDLVVMIGAIFRCMEDHVASESFLDDMETRWSQVPMPNERQSQTARLWQNGDPGEYLYTLEPSLITGQAKGTSREPSIKHYLGKDLYTFLKYVDTEEPDVDPEGYHEGKSHVVKPGDKILVSGVLMHIDSLAPAKDFVKYGLLETDLAAKAQITLSRRDQSIIAEPLYIIRDSIPIPDIVELKEWGLKMSVQRIDPHDGSFTLAVWEHESIKKDFIVMQAIVFPHINVLWLGCLIMMIGTFMAVRHRIRLSRKKQ